MSLAFEHILNNISVIIRDDEIIVGCRTSKLKGAPLFPENKSLWIEGDLENFDKRVLQRAMITQEEKDELAAKILPFWKGKTVEERMQKLMPEDVLTDMDKYIFTMMLEITYGIGHFTMNHPRVLARGLRGVIDDAEQKLAGLSPEEKNGEKGLFYEAVIRNCRAVISFAQRYSELALAMAAAERDRERAAELREIARVCSRVPEYPAETLHEAVQSLYFIHLVAQIESGGNSISLGRIDQILFPYYRKDSGSETGIPGEGPGTRGHAFYQDERDLERPRGGLHPRRRGHRGQDDAERHRGRRGTRRAGRDQRHELYRPGRLRRREDRAAQFRRPGLSRLPGGADAQGGRV